MGNGLKTLPDSFGHLAVLQTVHLQGNALAELPMSFSDLITLRTCDLERNKLASLPMNFWQLTALQTIKLSNFWPLAQLWLYRFRRHVFAELARPLWEQTHWLVASVCISVFNLMRGGSMERA